MKSLIGFLLTYGMGISLVLFGGVLAGMAMGLTEQRVKLLGFAAVVFVCGKTALERMDRP